MAESTTELSDESCDRLAENVCQRVIQSLRSSTDPISRYPSFAAPLMSTRSFSRFVDGTDIATPTDVQDTDQRVIGGVRLGDAGLGF